MARGSDTSGSVCGTDGKGARSLFTGVIEKLSGTEHVLREGVEHSELEPETKT